MEPTIACRELYARLTDDEVLVLDCRDDGEWDAFFLQIPGALPMTLGELPDRAHILPDDELIVLCGAAADGSDARAAYRLLRMRGRSPVVLEGGIRAWVAAGLPTEPPSLRRSHTLESSSA